MKHTRVLYWTKGLGERKKHHEHVFENVTFDTVEEVRRYMDYGHPGNFLIEEALNDSRHYILEDWDFTQVMLLSDEDLEQLPKLKKAEAALKKAQRENKRTQKEIDQIKGRIAEIDKGIKEQLARLGWSSLTDEEVAWFTKHGNKSAYFKPSAADIKAQYAQYAKSLSTSFVDPFEGFEELRSTNGWLDPYGKYYPVNGFAQHNAWAGEYLQKKGVNESEIKDYPHEYLEKLGWLRIMDWGAGTEIRFGYDKEPSHDQKETLYLFCALHKIKNPFV